MWPWSVLLQWQSRRHPSQLPEDNLAVSGDLFWQPTTVFLRSDAAGTIFFFFAVHFSAATTRGWLLFVYFIGKPGDSNDGWMRYMRGLQLGLIDAGSSTGSLSVLLSAVETNHRPQTAQEIAEGASAGIISTRFHALHILAMATIWGGVYFAQSSWLCGYYLRVLSNQRNTVLPLTFSFVLFIYFPFTFHAAHVVCVTPHGQRFAILSHFWMYSCSLVRHPCSVTRHLLEMSWLVSRDLLSSLWFECPGYVCKMTLYVALASEDIHVTNIYTWDSCQRIHVVDLTLKVKYLLCALVAGVILIFSYCLMG